MSMLSLPMVQVAGATLLALALLHPFACAPIGRLGGRWPRHAVWLHGLADVEVVFALWALVLLVAGRWPVAA